MRPRRTKTPALQPIMRFALAALCGLSLLTSNPSPAQADGEASLFVYLHTDVKPRALQKMLESQLPGVAVTVFGRVGDFKRKLKKTPPDAVLALRPVLEANGLKPGLQGTAKAATSEHYLVLSIDTAVTAGEIKNKVVGAVDLLGRKKMPVFVKDVLKTGAAPKVKRVTKTEDLLPLLQFQAADVVLLPESAVGSVKKQSQLNLVVTKVDGAVVGRAAVAFTNEAKRATLEKAIAGLNAKVSNKLGVDGWKKE